MKNETSVDGEHYDRVVAFEKKLKEMAESEDHPEWLDQTPDPVASYSLILGDDVTTYFGGAYVDVVPNDDSVTSTTFNFRIDLGPVNAQRLIDFLKTLPPEPEDPSPERAVFTFGDGHTCSCGRALRSHYTVLEGEAGEDLRGRMSAVWGNKWAFEYTDELAAGVSRFDMVRVFTNETDPKKCKCGRGVTVELVTK